MQLAQLTSDFALEGNLSFRDVANGFIVADIQNDICSASIALQGGHLMTWQPKAEEPVLWMSPIASLEAGKSIRGGVPICWPWFGAHPSEPTFSAHGFSRTALWEVKSTGLNELGAVIITLGLQGSNQQWQHNTPVEIEMVIGSDLEMTLTTQNLGKTPVEIGQALHTYFAVSDVRQIKIQGLEDMPYVDKLDKTDALKQQQGAISVYEEVDRIYLDQGQDIIIQDKHRSIRIEKKNSHSTIVWNPWIEKTKRLGDMGSPDAYLNMICVETANADKDVVSLNAGEKHQLFVRYSII